METMEEKIIEESILRLKIDNTDIFLEELGENKGKITISDTYGHNYSMYWGAMGGTLKEFISSINSDYFADKLLGHVSMTTFDSKKTFTQVRKFIREELDLPWYKHMEFQKDFREKLKEFENNCEEYGDDRYFVDNFYHYTYRLPNFDLITDKYERKRIENNFKEISEPWDFIHEKISRETKWLQNIHKKLITKLKKYDYK